MTNWLYRQMYFKGFLEQQNEDWLEQYYGFTYKITSQLTGHYYWGQKQFWSTRTKKLSKKASEAAYSGRGRRPTKTSIRFESDWREYKSSSKELQQMIKDLGEENFLFEIIGLWENKQKLSLEETKLIICMGALEDPLSLNSWVSCRIRKNNVI